MLPALAFADTKKIEGTTNVEDANMSSGAPNFNYGGGVYFYLHASPKTCMRVKNVASELGVGATISACVCSVYVYDFTTAGDASIYRIFKPWIEGTGFDEEGDGDVTFNDWVYPDDEWTTAGCQSADDGGSDNSGDGTGADRKATAESTVDVTGTGWLGFSITPALAQAWYDGTANENGVLFMGIGDCYAMCRSTEAETEKPFFVFTYTTGEPEAAGQVIMIH